MTRFRLAAYLFCALAAAGVAAPAFSSDDHDQAREALQRGEVRPLHEILAMLQREVPGEVVEVDFERDDNGLWIYEIRMIDPSGRFMKVYVDAARNTVLQVKMKHARSPR